MNNLLHTLSAQEYSTVYLPSELWQKDLEQFPLLRQYISVNMAKSTGEKCLELGMNWTRLTGSE